MKFYPIPLPNGKAKVRDADGIDRCDFDTLESAEAWIALEEHKQKWCIDNINRIKGLSYPQIERLYAKENQPEPDFDWSKVFNEAKLTEQQKWDMTTALLYEMIERREPSDSDNQPSCLGAVSCSSLQSLHQDLKGFQNMGFLTHDATMGLGIAIEQVERYMRGDLEARQ